MCIVIKSKYDKLAQEKADLQVRFDNLATFTNVLSDQLVVLEGKITTLQNQGGELNQQLDAANSQCATLQARIQEILTGEDGIKKQLAEVLAENSVLISDLTKTQLVNSILQSLVTQTEPILDRIKDELENK